MANSDARRETQWWPGAGCGIRATVERRSLMPLSAKRRPI